MKDREPDLAFLRFRSRKVPYKYSAPLLRRLHLVHCAAPTEDDVQPRFKMKVTGVYGGDATKRLVSEAVKIRTTTGQMNRQEEWRQIRLPRLGLS